MLRRFLAVIALAVLLPSAGCLHHRHFTRHHGGCCAPSCCVPSCCDGGGGPAFHGGGPAFHGPQ
jgi:hypothetical protein